MSIICVHHSFTTDVKEIVYPYVHCSVYIISVLIATKTKVYIAFTSLYCVLVSVHPPWRFLRWHDCLGGQPFD